MKELDEGIREYARKSGLSSKELATILANKTAVELYMTFHKNEARSEALWNDAYVFGLYSNTYKFNEAKKNSDYEDAIEFFDNVWNKEVTINCGYTELKLRFLELVNVCESTKYLDKKCSADAKAFLNGDFSQDDFMCLLETLDGVESVKTYDAETNIKNVFAEIISADELRSKLCEKIVAREFKEACDTIFTTFDAQVFKGCACCNFVSQEVSKSVVKSLKEKLEALNLIVSVNYRGESVEYTVKPAPTNGDYTGDYTEEELHRLLESHDGGAYYFVQNYCDKVYVPKFIKRIVSDVAGELRRVVKEGTTMADSVCIKKRETSTDAYATLFSILRDKGFKINEYEDEYEVHWDEETKH